MHSKFSTPFNLVIWSVLLPVLFFALQLSLTLVYAVWGYSLTPWLTFFSWFSVSTAVGFGIYTRFQPQPFHMLLLQSLACFHVFSLSVAVSLSSRIPFEAAFLIKTLGVSILLGLFGAAGFFLSNALRQWKSS